jgi:hypothetical protein
LTKKGNSIYFGFPILFFSTLLVLTAVTASQMQFATGSSTSPYQSGYNHGCSDARISDPSDRYINEPGKGPSFHTNEFMSGYNAGFNACAGGGGGGSDGTGTFAEGQGDGKAEGFRDAINGRPADNRCPSGQSNPYCIGYRLSYDIEYQVTKWLPRK